MINPNIKLSLVKTNMIDNNNIFPKIDWFNETNIWGERIDTVNSIVVKTPSNVYFILYIFIDKLFNFKDN